MNSRYAVWSLPFLLVILGVVWLIGHLPAGVLAAATALSLVYIATSWHLSRDRADGPRPIANVAALFPGHLLLLLAVSLVSDSALLGAVWCVLPVGTLAYALVTRRSELGGQRSILAGLYCIIWAVVFFLLERVIALGKGLSGSAETTAAVAFGVAGILFCGMGIYRHRRAVKE
jgi:hypothetical protein